MSALPPFDYLRPENLSSALAALDEPGARVLAGGTDLLRALRSRHPSTSAVSALVDVKDLVEAQGIRVEGEGLRIGALETARALASHRAVDRHATALSEAARASSAPALRGRATVGGNILTAHPAGDMATSLLALGARTEWASASAGRVVEPVEAVLCTDATFRHDPNLRILLAVWIPLGSASAFEKLGSRSGFGRSRASVGVARRSGTSRVAIAGHGTRPELHSSDKSCVESGLDPIFDALLQRAVVRLGNDQREDGR